MPAVSSKDLSIPTDEQIESAFSGTNFGATDYKSLVRDGLLKVGFGYHNGFTLNKILQFLGLVKLKRDGSPKLTERGSYVAWEWFRS